MTDLEAKVIQISIKEDETYRKVDKIKIQKLLIENGYHIMGSIVIEDNNFHCVWCGGTVFYPDTGAIALGDNIPPRATGMQDYRCIKCNKYMFMWHSGEEFGEEEE